MYATMEPNHRRLQALVVASIAFGLALPPAAGADEGGVPFWLSGQYASLSAVPPQPGWSMVLLPYGYSGSASSSKTFERAGTLTAGLQTSLAMVLAFPSYAPHTTILGGQPSFGLGFGFGGNWSSGNLVSSGRPLSHSDSDVGATDLYPLATDSWNSGNSNWMAYLTGDVPVGSYEDHRLSNLGIGHGAIDAGGGYTYLDEKNGHEFSAIAGFTYNFENPSTHYKNGIDSHLDWAASQFLSANWEVGIAGYVYYQLTADSGSGDLVGPFKSDVAAIGPEVGYVLTVGSHQWYANLRGYKEFWAEDRVQGYSLFLTLSAPFGG